MVLQKVDELKAQLSVLQAQLDDAFKASGIVQVSTHDSNIKACIVQNPGLVMAAWNG